MKHKIIYTGLADKIYYEVIAQYCLPSWEKLPGSKYIIHDSDVINFPFLQTIQWNDIPNNNSKFIQRIKERPHKKPWSFWRKMQTQIWSAREFKSKCDFVWLLDTDIEILDNFDLVKVEQILDEFLVSNFVWATGRSHSRLHDSGMIILNTKHPLYEQLLLDYEDIWESGKISKLRKPYDGDAVESMFEQYPSYKIMNIDYGKGFHVYDFGAVHYGSKMPKGLRVKWQGSGQSLVEYHTKDIKIKHYK